MGMGRASNPPLLWLAGGMRVAPSTDVTGAGSCRSTEADSAGAGCVDGLVAPGDATAAVSTIGPAAESVVVLRVRLPRGRPGPRFAGAGAPSSASVAPSVAAALPFRALAGAATVIASTAARVRRRRGAGVAVTLATSGAAAVAALAAGCSWVGGAAVSAAVWAAVRRRGARRITGGVWSSGT